MFDFIDDWIDGGMDLLGIERTADDFSNVPFSTNPTLNNLIQDLDGFCKIEIANSMFYETKFFKNIFIIKVESSIEISNSLIVITFIAISNPSATIYKLCKPAFKFLFGIVFYKRF